MSIKQTIRWATYIKFALAGALGGLAIVNTVTMLISSNSPTATTEGLAMSAGAVLLTGVIKALHVL